MRIKECPSLKVARRVVGLIQLPARIARECSVSSWSNCKEQGLHITRYALDTGFNRAVNVAEARSSDSIFICYGDSAEFDNQTHQESEAVYKTQSKYFAYNSVWAAAEWIAEYLKTGKV